MGARAWVVVTCLLAAGSARAQPDPCKGKGKDPATGKCNDDSLVVIPPPKAAGLKLTSDPPGAEVRHEGELLGVTPKVVTPLKPGTYRLRFKLLDHEDAQVEAVVAKGAVTAVHQKLTRKPSIVVEAVDDSAVGGTVYIDESPVATIPSDRRDRTRSVKVSVSTGKHVLRIEKPYHTAWQSDLDLPVGSPPQTLRVTLKAETGTLLVGRANQDDLHGVDVYLDPEPDAPAARRGGELGLHLGTTPLVAKVTAGKHVVVLRPAGIDPRSVLVEVPTNGQRFVAAEPPKGLRSYKPDDDDAISLERALDDCGEKYISAEACLVAGHAVAHPRGGKPDLARAATLYARGCEKQHAHACYAHAYLQLQLGQKEAARATFTTACTLGEADACWAPYLRLGQIPDPTLESGPRSSYRPKSKPAQLRDETLLVLGGTVGAGPYEGGPIYAEYQGWGSLKILPRRLYFDFGGGFRYRMARPRDEVGNAADNRHVGGVGFDLGVSVRPVRSWDLALRVAARLTAYFPSGDGGSVYVGAPWRFGRIIIAPGVVFDRVVMRVANTVVFAEEREFEDRRWRPSAMLFLGRVMEEK